MLPYSTIMSCTRLTANGALYLFFAITRTVFGILNRVFQKAEIKSSGLIFKADFSKGECPSKMFELFIVNGLRGMLEASYFQSITMSFRFGGALLDMHWGNDDIQVTKVYTKYVNVVNLIFRTFVVLNELE